MIQNRNTRTAFTGGPSAFEEPDFRSVFVSLPTAFMVLDMRFVIVAVSDLFCDATMQPRDALVGHVVYEVFPDNPDDSGATGVAQLRNSLLTVIRERVPHAMADMKYDIRRSDGVFEERYWRTVNAPVLGANGYVRWIVSATQDITHSMDMRRALAAGDTRVLELEQAVADLRDANAQLVERLALLRASLKSLP